ncbi:glucose/mannose transport system permease protein [Kribbella sp. VKM Ac-2527]|uniref:Glucose/mannose transport system permease protein n=1 Tax=Kribbella caucasensis TaxID=2512215 RepID=A0A4R6KR22_9ACTN|nr:carbohydrate ABC transporter permease [Kribbella sp. VKM Ac-2527]TDO54604.1 glucose/mannose transport system permease protein [Kribbella sp. VKM Ac-2527]
MTAVEAEAATGKAAAAIRQKPRRGGIADGTTRTSRTVKYLLLLLFLLFVLTPVYVVLITSFKTSADTTAAEQWSLPETWTLEPWRKAWDVLQPYMVRSLSLAVPAAIISSMIGSANGFVLARWRFPGANLVFAFILFGMFIPYQAVMLPLRTTFQELNVTRGVPTLIIAHVIYGIPICTLIFRNYYATIVPHEIIESARVDGAGLIQTYVRIILPISIAGFVVTLIWQFTSVWNDFLFALFLTQQQNGPVTLGLAALSGGQKVDYAASMAGALITSFPTLLVYILLGRWFIGGLMAGALKG